MSGNAEAIFNLIRTCKESLSNLASYKATAWGDETLENTWAGFISDIGEFRNEFLLFSRSLTSRVPVEALLSRGAQIQQKFTKDFRGVSDDGRSEDVAFVMTEIKACLECLRSLFYRFPTETPSVHDQYALLRDVDYEEDQYERSKMEERRKALTNKIEEMITKFPNDRLERRLVQLDAAIIEETERIYKLPVPKSALHFMQEENLANTIETQNLEILRLKRELAAKESSWWNTWKKWRTPTKTVDIDELLCRIQQL
jgi:hypothetical protein